MKATIKTPPVSQIAITQLIILLVLVVAISPVDVTAAYSMLVGGVIQVGPNAYFTRLAFRHAGARKTPEILRSIHKGEAGKLLLTAVFFALAFSYIEPLHLPGLFFSYGAMIIVQWFCAVRVLSNR
jgi:ATP synthase protein I